MSHPLIVIITIAAYFALLFLVSYFASRGSDNSTFFYRQPQGSVAACGFCHDWRRHIGRNFYIGARHGGRQGLQLSADGAGLYCGLCADCICACATVLPQEHAIDLRLS